MQLIFVTEEFMNSITAKIIFLTTGIALFVALVLLTLFFLLVQGNG